MKIIVILEHGRDMGNENNRVQNTMSTVAAAS